jgi:hypothetical protein
MFFPSRVGGEKPGAPNSVFIRDLALTLFERNSYKLASPRSMGEASLRQTDFICIERFRT